MTRVLLLTASLFLSLGLRLWLTSAPVIPGRQPLANFPPHIGQWELASEGSISARLEPVLGADDYLLRSYRNPEGETAELFTAYYLVQHAGESMHSPKNCMAGAGWEPIQRGSLPLIVGATGRPALVNSFVIEKDGQRFVLLYWYQVHGRMIASEYWLKAYLVWDAVCNRRRDGAMVRIIVPIRPGSDGASELNTAVDLARTSMLDLPRFLPA
jgi:EpsI family protein